jgi:uncharacterized protein DUF6228
MNEITFSIKSSCSDREFRFLSIEGEYFTVEFTSKAVAAKRRVWAYTDGNLLVKMFESMASAINGWQGQVEWSSIEGERTLTCLCDKLGHVHVDVDLKDDANGGERWSVSSRIQSELGQLPRIASDARRFFSCAHPAN